MQSLMTFNKKTEVFEQNINIFLFPLIMVSYIDDFSKMKSHDTPNSTSSDAKHNSLFYRWKRTAPPPYTAILLAKNLNTLVLNHGHFDRNSCELRILSY